MPENPEKKEWSQLSDQEKRAEEEIELKKREKEISPEEKTERGIEEEASLKESGLTKERENLEKAFKGPEKPGEEFKKYIDQNLPERLGEKEKSWQEEINKARTPRGQELMAAEKRSLERDLYLKELSNYSIKYEGGIKGTLRGFFTGKEKVKILKDGKPLEKGGKPLEFKVNWAWKHSEKDMIEFFKSEIENKIKQDLKKEWGERVKKEAERRIETPVVEQAELGRKALNASEFFARYLRANDLDEKDITPGKLEELHRGWKAYQKEMGIGKFAIPKGKETKDRKKMTEEMAQGSKEVEPSRTEPFQEPEPLKETGPSKKIEPSKKGGPEKKEWKEIDFKKMEVEGVFEKIKEMNMEKNAKDIIGIIKKYGPGISLPVYIEKLLKQYDQQRPEQYKLGKAKGNPESFKKWIAIFLTDIRYPERLKRLRDIKLGAKEKEEVKEKVGEEPKEEKTGKTEQVSSAESTVQPEEETLLTDEEEPERRPKKKKESAGDKKRLDWLEYAIKLRENGKFDQKMTNELKKFLKNRGITEEEIRRMKAVPEEAWEKAIEIYEKEQK